MSESLYLALADWFMVIDHKLEKWAIASSGVFLLAVMVYKLYSLTKEKFEMNHTLESERLKHENLQYNLNIQSNKVIQQWIIDTKDMEINRQNWASEKLQIRESFDAERQTWVAERGQLQAELNTANLAREALDQTLDNERQAWAAERGQLQDQLHTANTELENLNAERKMWDIERQNLQHSLNILDEASQPIHVIEAEAVQSGDDSAQEQAIESTPENSHNVPNNTGTESNEFVLPGHLAIRLVLSEINCANHINGFQNNWMQTVSAVVTDRVRAVVQQSLEIAPQPNGFIQLVKKYPHVLMAFFINNLIQAIKDNPEQHTRSLMIQATGIPEQAIRYQDHIKNIRAILSSIKNEANHPKAIFIKLGILAAEERVKRRIQTSGIPFLGLIGSDFSPCEKRAVQRAKPAMATVPAALTALQTYPALLATNMATEIMMGMGQDVIGDVWPHVARAVGLAEIAAGDRQAVWQAFRNALKHLGLPVAAQNQHRMYMVNEFLRQVGIPLAYLQDFLDSLMKYAEEQSFPNENIENSVSVWQRRLAKSIRKRILKRTVILDAQAYYTHAFLRIRQGLPENPDFLATALFEKVNRLGQEIIKTQPSAGLWRGVLIQDQADFRLEKQLELPEQFTGEQLQALHQPGVELSRRMHLMLRTPFEETRIASLTQLAGAGNEVRFRREMVIRNGVRLTGFDLMQPHSLILNNQGQEKCLSIKGEAEWSEDLPWIFIQKDGNWIWFAEGTANTTAVEARIVTPETMNPVPEGAVQCEQLGVIPVLHRVIYQITGQVDFQAASGEHFQVRCQADNEAAWQYVVTGDKLPWLLDENPVYRGMPLFRALDAEGNWQAHLRVQWKLVGIPGEWQAGNPSHGGIFWLRLVDQAGLVYCRRQVTAVPGNFDLQPHIGVGAAPGHYTLNGLQGADVQIMEPEHQGIRIEFDEEPGTCRIQCPVWPDTNLPNLRISLNWPEGSQVPLTLPYPQRGAGFRLPGHTLHHNDPVALGRLAGLRLLIQDRAGGATYRLRVTLVGAGTNRSFQETLPLLQDGRLDYGIQRWQDRIASLMASTAALDASVRLEVITGVAQQTVASVNVVRFDVRLQPFHEAGTVYVPPEDIEGLDDAWQNRVSLEMIRLWNPALPPQSLIPLETGHWHVPDELEPGPWWIIARDGYWARFRPLLWTVPQPFMEAVPALDNPGLAWAVRLPDPAERALQIAQSLTALGQSSNHPDWALLFDYFKLTQEIPPNALDVLSQLIEYPETLTLALLKTTEQNFDQVWGLAEVMPFSWGLLPVRVWEHAAQLYVTSLGHVLQDILGGGDILFDNFVQFRERAGSRRKYWNVLCGWLKSGLFPERVLPGDEFQLARDAPAILQNMIQVNAELEQELQARHADDWPLNPVVMAFIEGLAPPPDDNWATKYQHLGEPHRPVRYAPYLAAHIALNGIETPPDLIHELRLLRQFDPEWFDQVYAIRLALGLAQLPPENNL